MAVVGLLYSFPIQRYTFIVIAILVSSFARTHAICVSDTTEVFSKRTFFYVGGQYMNATLPESGAVGQYMVGQLYIERLVPTTPIHTIPLVFIPGNGQTSTNFLNTPDGRVGWASYFLSKGYTVYLTDVAQRGRSPWLPGSGSLSAYPVSQIEDQFTAQQHLRPLPYPQASEHTQWPGTGLVGDVVFDAFYASQVQFQSNNTLLAQLNNHSYAALLDRIGPAYVVTHSQSGALGWQLGDARPELVKGIVAMEPLGPPFHDYTGSPFQPGYIVPSKENRSYGVTFLPMRYDPPIGQNASKLQTVTVPAADRNESSCIRQKEPARQLSNLAKIPVLLLTSQASYHSVYDHCTVEYLRQAGVHVDHANLPKSGIYGNGHFMFMERNNLQVAEQVVLPWLMK